MGLDIVEVHMAIEDHFGIRLPANETFPQTVGDVFDAIKLHLQRVAAGSKAGACVCIPIFFEVRDVLRLLSAATPRIRPSTQLDQVLPRRKISAAWDNLETALLTRLPSLLPPKESGAVLFGWLGIVVLAELLSFLAFDVAGIIFASLLFIPVATWFAIWVNRQLPWQLPPGIHSVRDLVYAAMPAAAFESGSMSEGQLWERLVAIVSDQLDVPSELIRPESHFVRDLRCD